MQSDTTLTRTLRRWGASLRQCWRAAGCRGRLTAVAGLTAIALASWGLLGGTRDGGYLTATVDRGTVQTLVTASGTIHPIVTTKVSSQLSGQIADVLVDYNDQVRTGQVMAQLDPQSFAARVREASAELEMAQAELLMRRAAVGRSAAAVEQAHKRRLVLEAEARSAAAKVREITLELDRKEKLLQRSAIAQSEVDEVRARVEGAQALLEAAEAEVAVQDTQLRDAEASLTMAGAERLHAEAVVKQREAALDQAKVDLTRTDIRAPIDGVVIRRDVDIGQTVAASLQAPTLFTLAEDLRHMKVEVRVDEADIGQIAPGQAVYFTVDAFPGRRFEGKVVQIRKAPDVFQNVVTYSVIVSAENPDLALLPGMTAVVRVRVAEVRDALRIPNAALRFAPAPDDAAGLAADAMSDDARPDELPNTLWTLGRDGRPAAVRVRLGASDGQFSTVDAGALAAGDTIITGRTPEAAD